MFVRPLKIGEVKLKNNIFLAPMAGITDLPFRIIYEKFGVGLEYTEMASAKAIHYNDNNTNTLLNIMGQRVPVGIQLFGSEPEIMADAIDKIQKSFKLFPIIDINMGCPAPKVTKNGDGSSLLRNVDLIYDIVIASVKVSKAPVTVKIRTGWDSDNIVAVQVARAIESAGASAITVHGRTRDQFYTGKADLDIIKRVKDSIKIPVIGNGDIVDEKTALDMFKITNCDGIMIARGALGNPWIFKKLIHYFETGEKLQDVSRKEKLDTILEHLDLAVQHTKESVAIKEMRKHIAWYLKGLPDASKMRDRINKVENRIELESELIEYFGSI